MTRKKMLYSCSSIICFPTLSLFFFFFVLPNESLLLQQAFSPENKYSTAHIVFLTNIALHLIAYAFRISGINDGIVNYGGEKLITSTIKASSLFLMEQCLVNLDHTSHETIEILLITFPYEMSGFIEFEFAVFESIPIIFQSIFCSMSLMKLSFMLTFPIQLKSLSFLNNIYFPNPLNIRMNRD